MKNLGYECPVATKVRANDGFYRNYVFSDLMFTQEEPSERICSFVGLEEWEMNKKGALVKKRFSSSKLLKKLIPCERCPTCSCGKSHDWPCQIKVCGGLSVDVS